MRNSHVSDSLVLSRTGRAALTFLWVLCLGVSGCLLFGSVRDIVLRFVHDDAFYYYGIAWNWSRGLGSSFDGLGKTNGYHPLWQWGLLGVAGWFRTFEGFVRVASAAGPIALGLAGWLVYREMARRGNAFAPVAPLWIAGAIVFATIFGLESPLCILLFGGLMATTSRSLDRPCPSRGLLLGFLSAGLVLARIDAIVWTVALNAFLILRALLQTTPRKGWIGFLFALFAVQIVLLGGYFASNRLLWGHWLPVSALVKSARTEILSLQVRPSLLHFLSYPVLAVGFGSLGLLIRRDRSLRCLVLDDPCLLWLVVGGGMSLALIGLKGGVETYNWYFANLVFSGAWLIPEFLRLFASRFPRFPAAWSRRLAIAGCLLILAVTLRGKIVKSSQFVDSYDVAKALSTLPPDTIVFAATDCGILGSVSRQHCLNLDGLTNSFAFQESLQADRFADWLRGANLNTCLWMSVAPPPSRLTIFASPGIGHAGRSVVVDVSPGRGLDYGPPNARKRLTLLRVDRIRESGTQINSRKSFHFVLASVE